jgi:transposase
MAGRITSAAMAAEVSPQTAGKWVARFRDQGPPGLRDRSSAPAHVHNRTAEGEVEVIEALRHLRFTGPEIAELLDLATSTVSAVLKRIGLGRLSRLTPKEEIKRYEKDRPGELIHIDVKKARPDRGQRAGSPGPGSWQRAALKRRRLGMRPHRNRRLLPARLRRGPARREGGHRGWLPEEGFWPSTGASGSRWSG